MKHNFKVNSKYTNHDLYIDCIMFSSKNRVFRNSVISGIKEGEAFRGILYPKYLEMETFFLTLEHILRIQKKNFFGSDPRVETSGGNFVIFEALF